MLVLVWRWMLGGMWAIAGLEAEAGLMLLNRAIAGLEAEVELLMLGRNKRLPAGPSDTLASEGS
jgi:hypothetical protein